MAEFEAYKLEMRSPLHVGERGVGKEKSEETFHSDSLFSALCATIVETQGQAVLSDWLAAFLSPTPPLLLSSTFPYYGDVLLFPRPQMRLLGRHFPREGDGGGPQAALGRKTKDVAFVSQGIFERMAARRPLDGDLEKGRLLLEGRVWLDAPDRARLPEGLDALWAVGGPVPRVTVDRVSSRSAIYHVGRVFFQPGGGLYFLVRWSDETWRPLFEEVLGQLGHAGIGGERSAGHGQFRVHGPVTVDLKCPEGTVRQVMLSLYHPREDEVKAGVLDVASYDLLTRRGWIDSPQSRTMRRRTVQMLKEGSVVGRGAVGDIVDVTPAGFASHRVYRYGLAFPVGVEEETNGN